MSESRLSYLLQVYFDKIATPAERDELMGLLTRSEHDAQLKDLLKQTWLRFTTVHTLFNDSQAEEMLAHIFKQDSHSAPSPVLTKTQPFYFSYSRLAAAALLFITISGVYFWYRPGSPPTQVAEINHASFVAKKTVVPGGNKAVLTLADGSTITLDSTTKGALTTQGNVRIVKLNTATLAYKPGAREEEKVAYNTLSTPDGGQYQLILPDGTKVWLNASSSIHFPTAFSGKERDVSVTGEVYFEVAKNTAMPFKITVRDMEVQVFGTHFNIMAYDDESAIKTTLLEGSVKITKGGFDKMLVPGQQSMINERGDIIVADADIEEVMAWKNGWFQFNAYDIKTVMRQIARWYDVEIVYEGKVPSGHFSGLVSRSNDISQVLKIMQAAGVRFKIDGRKLMVLS